MQQTKLVLFCELFMTCCTTFEYFKIIAQADENHCYESNTNFINSAYASDIYLPFINKSELGDTKFINDKLNAKNVLEIPIPFKTINSLMKYFQVYVEPYLKEGKYEGKLKGIKGHEFYCISPKSWDSDVQWISVNSLFTYEYFLPYFKDIGLEDVFNKIIDIDNEIIVYNIFFVVRSKIKKHTWHIDFYNGTNVNAFTLLTPLQEENHVKLAYRDLNNEMKSYQYEKGTAIIFGENFMHSSDVSLIGNREVLFCISFGTDKLQEWSVIKQTAAVQGNHYMDPIYGYTNRTTDGPL